MLSGTHEKILIIDENAEFSGDLSLRLSGMGIASDTTDDAEKAMESLKKGHYGIVIMDPVDHIPRIRTLMNLIPGIVVLAISKDEAVGASIQAVWAGAVDLIPHRAEHLQLETAVRRAIDRRILLKQTLTLKRRITMLYVLCGMCLLIGFGLSLRF